MPKKLDWMTIFTGILALFAVLSFGALWIQLQDARENFRKDQRPYIWYVQPQVPEIKVGQKAYWNFRYSNFGKSPAIGVALRCQIRLAAHNTPELQDMFAPIHKPNFEPEGVVVPPNDSSNWTTCESGEIITEDDLKTNQAYDAGVKLMIFIEYFDTTGNPYISQICMFTRRQGQGPVGICRAENRIH